MQTRDDTDLFDKYTFLLMLFKEGYGGNDGGIPDTYDFKGLYTQELKKLSLWSQQLLIRNQSIKDL